MVATMSSVTCIWTFTNSRPARPKVAMPMSPYVTGASGAAGAGAESSASSRAVLRSCTVREASPSESPVCRPQTHHDCGMCVGVRRCDESMRLHEEKQIAEHARGVARH